MEVSLNVERIREDLHYWQYRVIRYPMHGWKQKILAIENSLEKLLEILLDKKYFRIFKLAEKSLFHLLVVLALQVPDSTNNVLELEFGVI